MFYFIERLFFSNSVGFDRKNAELALASDLLVFYTELLKRFLIIETQEEME